MDAMSEEITLDLEAEKEDLPEDLDDLEAEEPLLPDGDDSKIPELMRLLGEDDGSSV